MAALRQTNFRLEEDILEALQDIRERDGIPVTEQVRRALLQWIELKGIRLRSAAPKGASRRGQTRRKA
jgi:hypothetical protein